MSGEPNSMPQATAAQLERSNFRRLSNASSNARVNYLPNWFWYGVVTCCGHVVERLLNSLSLQIGLRKLGKDLQSNIC